MVVIEDLMDNHRSKLAEEVEERKHLSCACPQTLFRGYVKMCGQVCVQLYYHTQVADPFENCNMGGVGGVHPSNWAIA